MGVVVGSQMNQGLRPPVAYPSGVSHLPLQQDGQLSDPTENQINSWQASNGFPLGKEGFRPALGDQ